MVYLEVRYEGHIAGDDILVVLPHLVKGYLLACSHLHQLSVLALLHVCQLFAETQLQLRANHCETALCLAFKLSCSASKLCPQLRLLLTVLLKYEI